VRRHQDATATTADFTELASDVAGRDLSAFFKGWLYTKKTPPMPGHPDWRSDAPGKNRVAPSPVGPQTGWKHK
jgi:aminopeptidase N